MQNDFIEFMDIKLQSAEQTRLRVKEYFNNSFKVFLECEDPDLLRIGRDTLKGSIWAAFSFGLIDWNVLISLLRNVDNRYMSRRDELCKENK